MRAFCLQIKTHNLNSKFKKIVLRDLQYFQSEINKMSKGCQINTEYRYELFSLQKSLLNFGEYSFNHKTRKQPAVF